MHAGVFPLVAAGATAQAVSDVIDSYRSQKLTWGCLLSSRSILIIGNFMSTEMKTVLVWPC